MYRALISTIARAFGTEGTPINKTALLLELQAKVSSLNASLVALQESVDFLNETSNQIKKARFLEENETVIETPVGGWTEWRNASRLFSWSPTNTSNNMILAVYWFFDYKLNITNPYEQSYINLRLNATTDYEQPYIWLWDEKSLSSHTIKVKAFYNTTENIEEQISVWKFF